jgi:hypothetical protein
VAALVVRHLLPVDPHRGAIVDGAEVEEESLGVWSVEPASIPDHVSRRWVANPRQRRLRAERHNYMVRSNVSTSPPPNSHSPFKFTQRERLRIGRG